MQPRFECRDLGGGLLLPQIKVFISGFNTFLSLDAVEGSNLLETVFGDGGHIVVGEVKQLSTRVRLAVR